MHKHKATCYVDFNLYFWCSMLQKVKLGDISTTGTKNINDRRSFSLTWY
jgi:hypothetical protein